MNIHSKPLSRTIVVLALALVVAGCASSRWARSVIQEGENLCSQKRLEGTFTTYVEEARCKAEQIRPVLEERGYRDMDVVDLWLAYELAVAKKIDEGTLSEEEAEVLLATMRVSLNRELKVRDEARGRALQEFGRSLQDAGRHLQQAEQPPPMPRQYNCTSFDLGHGLSQLNCY